ncbi:MAG: hypothetical protein HQ595_04145, partial [Candidatus Omnitrophica bacterium]|nr:hypothetical protein [Candidatus Omnitrophota bacterium]
MAELYLRTRDKKASQKPDKKAKKKVVKKSRSASLSTRKDIYRLIGKNNNHFASFVARPKKLDFETKQKEEEIILLLRRHWATQIKSVLIVGAMIIAPLFLTYVPLLEFLPPRFKFIF